VQFAEHGIFHGVDQWHSSQRRASADFFSLVDDRVGVNVMTGKVTIYGIKACDTMKKARAWLEQHGVDYAFHDYKAEGIDRAHLEAWIRAVGWETVLNRAGTTFRKLPEADREGLNEAKAIKLMLAQPSMIKRPVLETGKGLPLVGFKPEIYAGRFG
jgi:arsenate reductase